MAHQSGRPQTSNGINECTFRLVLVGESAVGKSSLALRFAMGHFNDNQESTIGGKTQIIDASFDSFIAECSHLNFNVNVTVIQKKQTHMNCIT